MTPDQIRALDDLRPHMPAIRAAVSAEVAAGRSPAALLQALAERGPVALIDVCVGPQAPTGQPMLEATLTVAPVLEQAMQPKMLYTRLAALAPDPRPVLEHAASAHPNGAFLVALSEKVEGERAGRIHLIRARAHPAFTSSCWSHAEAGHKDGVIYAGQVTGRPEPAAALVAAGHLEEAALCAARTLERDPQSPVVPFLAATWGPDLDALLLRVVPHLRSPEAADALLLWTHRYPQAHALLAALRRGLAEDEPTET